MRALHVVHRYYPHVGGSEEVVRQLSERLSVRGHEVRVLTRWTRTGRYGEVGGVEVLPFRGPRQYVERLGELTPTADILMVYGYWYAKWLPFADVQCPVVYFPVGFDAWDRPIPRLYYETWQRGVSRRADVLAAITKTQQAFFASWSGHPRIAHIPNGVDFAYWQEGEAEADEETPFLLYTGGYYPNKRVEDLVRLLAILRDRANLRVKLVTTGPDPRGTAEHVRRLAVQQDLAGQVEVLRRIEAPHVRRLYHACSVHVSASDFEGFGLTFLEALACGKPVVCRPVGVAPELAEKTQHVFLGDDLESLATGVERLLKEGHDPAACRLVAQAYDWERVVDTLEATYKELA